MTIKINVPQNAILIIPIFVVAIMLLCIGMAYSINRPDFAVRGLEIAIPAILASFIFVGIYRSNVSIDTVIQAFHLNSKYLLFAYMLFFISSVDILLISPDKPLVYFISIVFLSIIIFLQIFSTQRSRSIILAEIVSLLLNIIYGTTLKYPLYYGGTDTLVHIFYSQVTYVSGHIIPADLTVYYAFYPLYHILIAASSYLMGMDITTVLFLVTAPIFAITVIFLYYIFYKATGSDQLPLLACLFYSLFFTVDYYGAYMVTRSLAFVGFIILLYLIYKKNVPEPGIAPNQAVSRSKGDLLFKALAIAVAVFLILVHQVSLIFISLLLLILILCEWLIGHKKYISGKFYLLLNILFFSYLFYIALPFAQNILTGYDNASFYGGLVIRSTILANNEWSFLIKNMDYFLFTFFALIGIAYLLLKSKQKYAAVFGLFALLTILLYIPNPIQTLWQTMELFRVDRFALLVSPFMAFVMAAGFIAFYGYLANIKVIKILSVPVILILFICFVATCLNENVQHETPRLYFNGQELSGYDYVLNHAPNGSEIRGDYFTYRYFSQTKTSESDALGLPYYDSGMIGKINDISYYTGYILIRDQEFLQNGLRFGNEADIYTYTPDSGNQQALYGSLSRQDKILSNNDLSIYRGNGV